MNISALSSNIRHNGDIVSSLRDCLVLLLLFSTDVASLTDVDFFALKGQKSSVENNPVRDGPKNTTCTTSTGVIISSLQDYKNLLIFSANVASLAGF